MKSTLQCSIYTMILFLPTNTAPPLAPQQAPGDERDKIISDNVNITCTTEISGIIIKINKATFMGKPIEAIVQKVKISGKNGAWAPKTKDKKLSEEVASTIWAIFYKEMFSNKLDIQEEPSKHSTIAKFTLYLTTHSSGNIKQSRKKGIYYDQQHNQCSGMTIVSYTPPHKPPTSDIAYKSFHKLISAFGPLAKQLNCNAIWIRAIEIDPETHKRTEKMGVIWKHKEGWTQIVPTATQDN